MEIKLPCIIDISHWETVAWPSLDARVVGVIMKATQGRYYWDPTFRSSWNGAGARGIPRSAFHFFEPNDISQQASNFLTVCEDVGAIVSGKWQSDLEPVLDAEYQPPSTADAIRSAFGFKSSQPNIRRKALLDLQSPDIYLKERIIHRVASDATAKSVTGAELANQYKTWLDLVEAELHVRPIIYTSKWMWNYTGNPAWSKNYKLWVAQYPYNPDGQNAPAYLPTAWEHWWLWQYTAQGQIAGVDGFVDINTFAGTPQEWDYFYGGGYQPPEPPGEAMYQVTPVAGKAYVNVRSNHATTAADIGDLYAGQIAEGSELWTSGTTEKWLHVTKVNGVAKDGWVAVVSSGVQFTVLTEVVPPSANPKAAVTFTDAAGKVFAGEVELKPQ